MMVTNAPIHTIIETKAFSRRIKELGLSTEELMVIYDTYAALPDYGKVVKRTAGLRKGRIAKDGAGKRGGYRVFSFYLDSNHPVFLLRVIDKVQDDTPTDVQEAVLKTLITTQIGRAHV